MITFRNNKQAITTQDLDDFENEFDIVLPQKYREMMLIYNGGRPDPAIVYTNGERGSIGAFYSIKYGKQQVSLYIKWVQIEEQNIPINFLPIARDEGGNNYTLKLDGDNIGEIHLWYSDTEDVEKEKVADDLEEFLGGWVL